jgi:hypothetical protein
MSSYSPSLGASLSQAAKRRVYFAFHYQNDISRVNIVRNSWVIRPNAERQGLGFYDASIWEDAKRNGAEAIKDLIRKEIENTSVTCVLAGQCTYSRTWVRYEIARSIVKGNGLFTVHISALQCMRNGHGVRGPNPLEYMGLYRDPGSGKVSICEIDTNGKWVFYTNYTNGVSWPPYLPQPSGDHVQRLSAGTLAYDYAHQNGYNNFSGWVALAASEAGR